MIATLGMLEALQPQDNNTPGIIDIIMNMSCLSGSTWAILPMLLDCLWMLLKQVIKICSHSC